MGEDELRAEIAIATDEAFKLADALAVEVANCRMGNPAWRLAREYSEKRRYIVRLRAALKVEVAG